MEEFIKEARGALRTSPSLAFTAVRKTLEAVKAKIPDTYKDDDKIAFEKIYGHDDVGEAFEKIFQGLWRLANIYSHTTPPYTSPPKKWSGT